MTTRVLVIHWGSNGGGPLVSQRMAKGLAADSELEVFVSYSSYADNTEEWESLKLPTLRVRTYRTSYQLLTRLPQWILSIIRLRRFIRDNSIDVVYSGMLSLWPSLAMPLTVPRRTKFVSSIHDAYEHKGEQRKLIALARRKELHRADAVVAFSAHSASQLKSQVGSKPVITLELGADSPTAKPRTVLPSPITIGFFGRIVAYKGIDLFVETLRELQNRGIEARGRVVGSGVVPAALLDSTRDLVQWDVRWIDKDDIEEVFGQFDLLLLPYLEASQSGVVSQAATHGVPVVSTPVGALPDQVQLYEIGFVAEEVTSASLADQISRIVTDPQTYASFSVRAMQNAATTQSWEANAVPLAAFIRENY